MSDWVNIIQTRSVPRPGPCKVAGGWVEVVGGEDDGDGNIPTHPQYPRYEDTKQ